MINKKERQSKVLSPKNIRELNYDDYKFRDWDYLKSNNYKNIIIEGRFKKKVNISPKKEQKIFNNIKLFPQPNTKRTILPDYAPINEIKPSKKKVNIESFSKENKKNVQGKKVNFNNNKESKDEIQTNIRHIKNSKFQDYKTTQITNLPGAVTRNLNDINDDKNDFNKIKEKKIKQSYFINKLKNDYYSDIACLPNSLTNNMKNKQIIRGKTYNNFNYKNKNMLGTRGKIKRKKNVEYKERPFSSDRFNYNNNYDTKINENEYNNNMIKKYKNAESYQSFDMLKPSSIFEKRYELRVKIL